MALCIMQSISTCIKTNVCRKLLLSYGCTLFFTRVRRVYLKTTGPEPYQVERVRIHQNELEKHLFSVKRLKMSNLDGLFQRRILVKTQVPRTKRFCSSICDLRSIIHASERLKTLLKSKQKENFVP